MWLSGLSVGLRTKEPLVSISSQGTCVSCRPGPQCGGGWCMRGNHTLMFKKKKACIFFLHKLLLKSHVEIPSCEVYLDLQTAGPCYTLGTCQEDYLGYTPNLAFPYCSPSLTVWTPGFVTSVKRKWQFLKGIIFVLLALGYLGSPRRKSRGTTQDISRQNLVNFCPVRIKQVGRTGFLFGSQSGLTGLVLISWG